MTHPRPLERLSFALIPLLLAAFHGAMAQPQAPDQVIVKGPKGEALHRYLQWAEVFGFNGAVLTAWDGEIFLHNAYGLADRKAKRPNTIDHVFSFGSIAKQFTGAGIVHLMQEGKLDVRDPITKYLDDIPPDKTTITIHQLLNHTAGVVDALDGDDFDEVSRDEALRQTMAADLIAEVGAEFNYSNAGVSVAAAIIEFVSGQEYRAYLREHLFAPAGMTQIGFMGETHWPDENVARIYSGNRKTGAPNTLPGPFWILLGNGGSVTTVGEMYLWHRALQGEAILSADAKRAIFTPDPPDFEYGYGWDVLPTPRGTVQYGHDGGSSLGLSAQFFRFPDEDGAMIIASNATLAQTAAIEWLTNPVHHSLLEVWHDLPEAPTELRAPTHDEVRSLSGPYSLGDAGSLRISRLREELVGYLSGQDLLEAVGAVADDDRDAFRALQEKAVRTITRVYKNDLKPLEEALGSAERAAAWATTFREWAETHGAFRDLEVLGTRRVWEEGSEEPVTWLRAHFENGSQLFRIHWHGDRFGGRGGQAWPTPLYGPLRFTDDGAAVLFHFDTAATAELRFKGMRNGKPRRVTLVTQRRSYSGNRVD